MDQVSQVREKIDIVSLVAEFIPLKKMGRNFTTLCPFHSEKSPSFVVSPERQIWHCFGCSKGGDCFSFLMEYENIEFPEALRMLAKRAGVVLEQSRFVAGVTTAKEKIYKLNKISCEFYHYVLIKHKAGEKALSYLLEKRRVKEATINTFMLGFAPRSGFALFDYLIRKKGFDKKDLFEAGLATGNGDFFVNRLIFPLFDHRGNIIGFSGRTLDDPTPSSGQAPKYINTKETLVYHKGSVFFGLNIAKAEIKKENRAVIMEGEFDVISSFQEGVGNAVAVKGTALTESQANLISRFAKHVSLCFDRDFAGGEALKRSLPLLEARGLTIGVVDFSDSHDPDEAIKENPLFFKKSVRHDTNVYDYLLEKAVLGSNRKTSEGKRNIADNLLPIILGIGNEIVKEHYLRKLAGEIETSYESLAKQAERLNKPKEDVLMHVPAKNKKTRREILEEYLLSLIFQSENPSDAVKEIEKILSFSQLASPAYDRILSHLLTFLENGSFDPKKFVKTLPSELLPAFDVAVLRPLPNFSSESKKKEEIIKVAQELRLIFLRDKIKETGDKIKAMEKENMGQEGVELANLKEQFLSLVNKLGAN